MNTVPIDATDSNMIWFKAQLWSWVLMLRDWVPANEQQQLRKHVDQGRRLSQIFELKINENARSAIQ